jgi:RNA polymerase sigma factor (sigma-70 family)
MPGHQDGGKISQAYREHRPYLVDLAFRMLGDIGAAEDVVQDAFARLLRTGPGEIDDERGWLIVVTSRLCLDQISSARLRRERAHDPGEIEAAAPAAQPELADPADRVSFDDSVHLALLVVLQRLTPAERVALVLHDIFQMPFETVAQTMGRTAAACRQLATRARQRISGDGSARFEVTSAEHRLSPKSPSPPPPTATSAAVEVLAPMVGRRPSSPRQAAHRDQRRGTCRPAPAAFWGPMRRCLPSGRRGSRRAPVPWPRTVRRAGVHHARRNGQAVHVIADPLS